MLEGKVALITGGASGIGYAITKKITEQGAKVVIADIDQEGISRAADELHCTGKAVDLSTRAGCEEIIKYAAETYGKIDILGNVAGIQHVCPIDRFPEEKWEFMINLMLNAPFYLTKGCMPYMKANNWGRIINISSIHGLVASEYKSCYVSAKHGLYGMTKAVALEGGPFHVTANCICPAYVMTPLVEGQIKDQAEAHHIPEEQVISEIMLSKAAIKKMVKADDIANVFSFLCSSAADSITGISLPVDGGWTAN